MSLNKRIFIGTFLTIDIEKHLTQIKKDFGGVISGRWVKKSNLHLTFKFIGDVPVERIHALKEVLSGIIDVDIDTEIYLKGLGVFPNINQPKILYLKVKPTKELLDIQKEVEDRLYILGFKKEIKRFIPHITINRIKEAKISQLMEKLQKYEEKSFGSQKRVRINIIESILNREGAEYRPIV
ncbi:MAG: RNA 2',3'-cyclic phosphodiesterase [Hydrogenothermaceae bacterium]|nr:RNA 2',3'-cyclic phosphodiesterase [Hydrogenothermaceae bacterium]